MEIVIYLYHGLTALDAVGPYEILIRLPNSTVKFVAKQKGVVLSDTHFLKMIADYDLVSTELVLFANHSDEIILAALLLIAEMPDYTQ